MIRKPALLARTAIVGLALTGALLTNAVAATASFATTAKASSTASFATTAKASSTASLATTAKASSTATPADVRGCSSSTKNWVALYPSYADWAAGRGATHCIGDKGTWDVPANNTQVFCAGNNSGIVTFLDRDNGRVYKRAFSSDRSYSAISTLWIGASPMGSDLDIMTVEITGWTGSAGC
jgi:hypothetical protein